MAKNQAGITKLIDNWEDMIEAFYRLSVMYSAFPFLIPKIEPSHEE